MNRVSLVMRAIGAIFASGAAVLSFSSCAGPGQGCEHLRERPGGFSDRFDSLTHSSDALLHGDMRALEAEVQVVGRRLGENTAKTIHNLGPGAVEKVVRRGEEFGENVGHYWDNAIARASQETECFWDRALHTLQILR